MNLQLRMLERQEQILKVFEALLKGKITPAEAQSWLEKQRGQLLFDKLAIRRQELTTEQVYHKRREKADQKARLYASKTT